MAQECLDATLCPLTNSTLAKHPHSSFGQHNLHSSELPFDDHDAATNFKKNFKQIGFSVTYPLPLFSPSDVSLPEINGYDISLDLVRRKKRWEIHKDFLLKATSNLPKNTKKRITSNSSHILDQEEIKLPKCVSQLADHLAADPDKMFSGSCNWYYSGGNLETITIGDDAYLVSVHQRKNCFNLTKLSGGNNEWDPYRKSFKMQLKLREPVYQVEPFEDTFLSRQRSSIKFYKFRVRDEKVEMVQIYNDDSEDPYISSAVNKYCRGQFASLSIERYLVLYDVFTNSIICEGRFPRLHSNPDRWGRIEFYDSNCLLSMDRSSIGLIDSRVDVNSYSAGWEKYGITCNYISSSHIVNPYEILVGQRHTLSLLDPRKGFVVQWTHNMPHFPMTIKSKVSLDRYLVIAMAGQRTSNVYISVGTEENLSCRSPGTIHSIPSPYEALYAARRSGTLDESFIESRLSSCLTGLCLFQTNRGLKVLRSSSMGDVFHQYVEIDHCCDSICVKDFMKSDLNGLQGWSNQCRDELLDSDHPSLYTAENSELSELSNEILEYVKRSSDSEEDDPEKYWFAPKQINTCMDPLSQNVRNQWELSEDEMEQDIDEAETVSNIYEEIGKYEHIDDDHHMNAMETNVLPSSDDEDDLCGRINNWLEGNRIALQNCQDDEEESENLDHYKQIVRPSSAP